jgi:hypothetical protein
LSYYYLLSKCRKNWNIFFREMAADDSRHD